LVIENPGLTAQEFFQNCGEHSHLSPPAVSDGGLSVVTRLAQRLPVVLIPEECGIAFVWDDVIGNGRSDQAPMLHAFDAERIASQERFRCDAPSKAIAARYSIPPPVVLVPPVLLSMPLASSGICQGRATRIAAWALRRIRAQAAFLFGKCRTVRAGLGRAALSGLRSEWPFSITYPGRRFSSR